MPRGQPTWIVAVGLLALVLVILGGAFFLNARLKPQVGIQPAGTAVPSTAPTPALTAIASPVPTVGGAVPSSAVHPNAEKAAVVQAYLHYWEVYSNALLTLDASQLPEAMSGDELQRAQEYVNQLKEAHQALKTDVDHQYEVTSLTPDSATLDDQLVNRSYLVDPSTKLPLGSPEPATPETIAYRFQVEDGVWKVTSAIKVFVTVVNQ